MNHGYEIRYENVYLRPLREEDIESLRKWRNNPSNTIYLKKIPYITPEMQRKWFDSYIDNNDEMCFAIVEDKDLHRLVGSLSLYQFDSDKCFFGKILIGDAEAHGRKVGLNATLAATKIAFEQLNIKIVQLHVYKDNLAAFTIYNEAGFIVLDEHCDASGQVEFTMAKYNGGKYSSMSQ